MSLGLSQTALAQAVGLTFQPAEGSDEVAADLWFNDWRRGGVLLEEARHLKQWDQTLALLWFADEEIPVRSAETGEPEEEEEPLLRELDGVLPWPGKKRRK